MIVSFSRKFIYFSNGKTGSSSIDHLLSPYDENQNRQYSMYGYDADGIKLFGPKHTPPAIVKALVPDDFWKESFKFIFARNPYDWLVSQWFFNFGFRHKSSFLKNPDHWFRRQIHPFKSTMGRNNRELCSVVKLTADDIDFIYRYMATRGRKFPNKTSAFQSSYVLDSNGQQIVDFIGRFESIADDFGVIKQKIGLPELELIKKNSSSHRSFEQYYTEASAKRVYELWAEDFEVLGYPSL